MMVICRPAAWGQPSRSLDGNLCTLQVQSSSDPMGMPIIALGSDEHIDIGFDLLTHEYQRLSYRIEHCNFDWTPTEGLFDSDYLEGFDGQPIEDYEKSFNTSVLYTHYRLQLPNDEVALRLSGNYRVKIINEDDDDRVIAEACFMAVEPGVAIKAEMTTHTDLDINNRHQQIEFQVNYGGNGSSSSHSANTNFNTPSPSKERAGVRMWGGVIDPLTELRSVVIQNRRWDNRVVNPTPNIQGMNMVACTHQRNLIFDAGAECHKFEFTDKNQPAMGVDHIEYHAPYEHAVLYPVTPARTYNYDEDFNGAFVIRDKYDESPDTQSEYIFVHFALQCAPLPHGQRVYLQGDLTHGQLLPQYEMSYNDEWGGYELTVLLKQGYYEYRFVHCDPDSETSCNGQTASNASCNAITAVAHTALTEGDFHETRNTYTILVYHRPRASRYDRLVGVKTL